MRPQVLNWMNVRSTGSCETSATWQLHNKLTGVSGFRVDNGPQDGTLKSMIQQLVLSYKILLTHLVDQYRIGVFLQV